MGWRDLLRDDPAARPPEEQGGGWAHIPTWDGDDPEEGYRPSDVSRTAPPLAAHAQLLPEEHIEGDADADLDAASVWDDLQAASQLNPNPSVPIEAASRLGRRGMRAARELAREPGATLSGLVDGGSFGWGDEAAGVAGLLGSLGQPEGLPGSLPSDPLEAYAATRDMVRDYDRDAEARAPTAHAAGEVAGTFLPALLTGGATAEAEAPGFLASVGRGARTGAAAGAVGGAGSSDRTGAGLAEDTALSALAGGAAGGVLASVPATSRSLRARAPAAQEAADLARVASVGGGRGTISRTDPRIAEFARLPGGIPGQAARIRRLGLVGALETPEAVAERTRGVLERLLTDGPMVETRRRIAESGAEVPVSAITDALEREARSAESMAATRPYAEQARGLGQRFTDTYARAPATTVMPERGGTYRVAPEAVQDLDATLPYQRAVEELGALDGEIPWTSERLAADAARSRRRSIRDALDSWVEEQLGPEEASRYRGGRLDYQTARVAADQAAARAASIAGNRAVGLTDVMAMSGAQSPTAAALRFALNRGAGLFGPTGRATGREAIARLLGALPEGTSSTDLESLAGRISPDLLQQLQDSLSGGEVTDPQADPFADLGAVADESAAEPTTTTAPTEAAPDAPDPFAALGAVPDEEEE